MVMWTGATRKATGATVWTLNETCIITIQL
jgi:hypothetical protein